MTSAHMRTFVMVPEKILSLMGNTRRPGEVQEEQEYQASTTNLDDTSIPEDVRLVHHIQGEQRHLIRKGFRDEPVKMSIHHDDDDDEDEILGHQGKSPDVLQGAVNTFDRNNQVVRGLAAFMTRTPGLQWNSRGEIIVGGERVHNSSLTNLMTDVVANEPSINPTGSTQFARVLKNAGIPANLVGETTGKYRAPPQHAPPGAHYVPRTPNGAAAAAPQFRVPPAPAPPRYRDRSPLQRVNLDYESP